jgi:hypothetical protein
MKNVFKVNYAKDLAIARTRIAHDLQAKRWDYVDPETRQIVQVVDPDLNKQIVPAGMKLLVKQLYLARDDVVNNRQCSGDFETIYGIPCYHSLHEMQQLKVNIARHHFHRHWHFERPVNTAEDGERIELPAPPPAPPAPTIFAPHVVVTRGRQRRDRTTRRDPSQFELTQGPLAPPPARRPGRVGGETSAVSYNTIQTANRAN